MKIVIAPDSFKESLTALDVARAIERGLRAVWPDAECSLLPMADGGEGTVQALVDASGGRRITETVSDPLGRPVQADYGVVGADPTESTTAVIEMAEASGLHRVSGHERNPNLTSSRGTGELIRAALDSGARRLILGLGGSATNDGGAGMLAALGARLLDAEGADLPEGGAALARLSRLDLSALDPRLQHTDLIIASDVTNPLCGPQGASAVFGPQKGASAEQVKTLDDALNHFAECLAEATGIDARHQAGAGAAGGLGVSLMALGGELKSGIEVVAEAVGLTSAMAGADLVFTGEGKLDGQTLGGKTPLGVARVAKAANVPVIALGGAMDDDAAALMDAGINALFGSVQRPMSLPDALAGATDNLERVARQVAASIELGRRLAR
ncbi:glycerate kinase [Saccharospirillum sp. HFRX-1]|uniref:glycerate kinase n=1 Tax=unclassified Saccharospirillum TaxID=2633430 RepID=UPI003711319C